MIQGFNSLSYILQGWFGGWASGVSGERTSQPGKIKKKLWNLSVGAWPSQDQARVKPDGVMPECVPVKGWSRKILLFPSQPLIIKISFDNRIINF